MSNRIPAIVVFVVGAIIVAAPLILRLGWLMAIAGMVLGVALGVTAGIIWITAKPISA
jgi:hypothetical protein